MRRSFCTILALCCAYWLDDAPALEPFEVAIIFSSRDEHSVELALAYAGARNIPARNLIGIDLDTSRAVLPAARFTRIASSVAERLGDDIQALALAWTFPYRVGCMSVTSAFTFGFDERHCATGCAPTAPSPYFESSSRRPYTDHGVRPAMLLAAPSVAAARALIERGVKSDYTQPPGTAYLVITDDRNRNTRKLRFALARSLFGARHRVSIVTSAGIVARDDVMFYFTGTRHVPYLESLTFRPGAIADHLTSAGGVLDGTRQMNVLAWIEAGATGSYGTVVEPCNYPQKFPDPPTVLGAYLNGETLVEAYWKSVAWPGQGLFVGEPLARPFARRPAAP
jgi:uncharacterized protein (TIGR03790 family)